MTTTLCGYCDWTYDREKERDGPIWALYWHYRLNHEPVVASGFECPCGFEAWTGSGLASHARACKAKVRIA